MENQRRRDDPIQDLCRRRDDETRLRVRAQYTEAPPAIEDPSSSLLLEYWDILRRRKGTLFLIAFLGLLLSVLLTLPQTPIYQARASLEIQSFNENFLNMRNVSPTDNDGPSSSPEVDLRTEVKIIQSESVLERVIAKLDLEKNLSHVKNSSRLSAWRNALGLSKSKPALSREDALRLVAGNLKILTEPNTRLVEILYDCPDPQLAADIANSLTHEFIQKNLEARVQTTQETGKWLTSQMEDVRIKLEKSEDELQSYANASGLLFTSEKDNVADEQFRQLQEELSKARADRIANQSKYELASTAPPESLPEVLDDLTLKDYQVKLTDLRRQYAELSSSLTASHPTVKKVQAEITTLESALEKERTSVIERIRNEFKSAQRRENLLAGNYASQARLISEQAAKVAHYNILKREVDTNRQLYESLLRDVQQAAMTSALSASNVRVVDAAKPPTHPYKPNLVSNAALGLLEGAFLGVVFVVVRGRADRSIQAPGETALYLDVPELGVIPLAQAENLRRFPYVPYFHKGRSLDGQEGENDGGCSQVELVTSRSHSILADSFQATLTSILCLGENGDRPSILVLTSANPGEGKTTVASNLALALAEIGKPVLLIDGDLRRGRLHHIFQASNSWGLSDLLAGKEISDGGGKWMVLRTSYQNLYLLPAGSVVSNISAKLHSPRALEFLYRMRQEFYMVIIDTPPMLHMPDARLLGRLADGVILVVRSAQTAREAAAAASQRLMEDGSRVLGTILNEWDPRRASGYGYGYTYQYYDQPNRD